MSNCFVIRPNSVLISTDREFALRGHFGTGAAIDSARAMLDVDGYQMVASAQLGTCKDAEEVFDKMNTKIDYMAVGDIIVWNTGKRELCLKSGWATI